MLGIKDLSELEYEIDKLKRKNIKFTEFREPDLNNEITSIAVYSDKKLFRNLELMGG